MVMDLFQIMPNRLVVFEIILVIHASTFCELNLDENYTIHKMITVVWKGLLNFGGKFVALHFC
jgi:hypothetical protein